MRFWDSSALVPLLVKQQGSARADRWFRDDPAIVLWTLSPVEITSALWRLVRGDEIAEADAHAGDVRAQELASASYVIVDVEGVKQNARRLLRIHQLRAADALQLGAAVSWAGGQPQGQILHTLDERLSLAAKREGFEVP